MAPSRSRTTSLKAGRPPAVQKPQRTLNSKATQKTIVSYHQLNKDLAKAKSINDTKAISLIEAQIQSLGGLKAYQAASIQGQSASRGGDSSIILMDWLTPVRNQLQENKFRMLEIGALSTKNACSKSSCFDITRIDLNSQEPGIQKQDFMHRPLPNSDEEQFDIISLSLVLNFVPNAEGRGEMLRRTTNFLHKQTLAPFSATLFLVLPAPCVLNSRYFCDERLCQIMASLGYVMLQRKQSSKLVYWLWQLRDEAAPEHEQNYAKMKVRDGPGMNNFHVELKPPEA